MQEKSLRILVYHCVIISRNHSSHHLHIFPTGNYHKAQPPLRFPHLTALTKFANPFSLQLLIQNLTELPLTATKTVRLPLHNPFSLGDLWKYPSSWASPVQVLLNTNNPLKRGKRLSLMLAFGYVPLCSLHLLMLGATIPMTIWSTYLLWFFLNSDSFNPSVLLFKFRQHNYGNSYALAHIEIVHQLKTHYIIMAS